MKTKKTNAFFIILCVLLFVYLCSMVFVISWALISSFKGELEFFVRKIGLPKKWDFSNLQAVSKMSFDRTTAAGKKTYTVSMMYTYTILYTVGCAFFSTLIPCITGYLCAKFKKALSAIIVTIVIVTMSLPIVGSTPSTLQLVTKLGIYDTIWGMWLMSANFQMGIHFLVLYESFVAIPNTYKEAAEIDGASNLKVLTRIMMPLVKNVFITIFLLRFIGLWNDYQTPLLYIPNKPTISYGLYMFSIVNTQTSVPIQIAGSFLVSIPILILFILLQKRIMTNLSMGGIKG